MSWEANLLDTLLEGNNLSLTEARAAMQDIMGGLWNPEQIAAFLVALRAKGETIEEIVGAAKVMREVAEKVEDASASLDIVGTGGDGAGTLNLSTAAAFVAHGAGVRIAKHGKRSVSSKCGSADVLEALGARIDLTAAQTGQVFARTGFCFMFAQVHHPSMRHVAPIRRSLGVRTIFNLLGPLTNPAGARHMVVGIYDQTLVEPIAYVLKFLGVERALVVHGEPGIDEISASGRTWAALLDHGEVEMLTLIPENFGAIAGQVEDIAGGDATANAASIRALLSGGDHPAMTAVCLNAAAGIRIAGFEDNWLSAMGAARAAITNGSALRELDAWVAATQAVE